MKKLIPIILLICICLTGCGSSAETTTEEQGPERLKIVFSENKGFGTGLHIIVDSDTGVMYMFAKSGYGGGLTTMLDAAGNPMLWSEEEVTE